MDGRVQGDGAGAAVDADLVTVLARPERFVGRVADGVERVAVGVEAHGAARDLDLRADPARPVEVDGERSAVDLYRHGSRRGAQRDLVLARASVERQGRDGELRQVHGQGRRSAVARDRPPDGGAEPQLEGEVAAREDAEASVGLVDAQYVGLGVELDGGLRTAVFDVGAVQVGGLGAAGDANGRRAHVDLERRFVDASTWADRVVGVGRRRVGPEGDVGRRTGDRQQHDQGRRDVAPDAWTLTATPAGRVILTVSAPPSTRSGTMPWGAPSVRWTVLAPVRQPKLVSLADERSKSPRMAPVLQITSQGTASVSRASTWSRRAPMNQSTRWLMRKVPVARSSRTSGDAPPCSMCTR